MWTFFVPNVMLSADDGAEDDDGKFERPLRDKMGVENNTSTHMFIQKNLDLIAEVASIVQTAYGKDTYSANLAAETKIKTEAQMVASMVAFVECDDPSDDFSFPWV
eukprot:jgi/Tetstr1/457253/TSEL_004182.t1